MWFYPPYPPRGKELYLFYVLSYFIINYTETIVKAVRIFRGEFKRGGEGATPWTLLWGYHVYQFKVKGEVNKKYIKSPPRDLQKTQKTKKAHK